MTDMLGIIRLGLSRLLRSILLAASFVIVNVATVNMAYADIFRVAFISTGIEDAARMQSLIIDELSPFITDSSTIEFATFTAKPTPESFQKQIDIAYSNSEIDAVIAPGFLGSQFIYNQAIFSKPTFLAWIVDPNLIGGEVKNDVPNLHWLSTHNDLESTFKTIAQVIGEKPITLVVDTAAANLGVSFFEGLKKNAKKFGLDLSVTLLDRTAPTLGQISPKYALALVPPMHEGSENVIKQIQAGNIPVFTFEGPKVVEEGAMMTDLVEANESLIARSIALDIYGLLQGEKIEPGPNWLESEHHLTLNIAAAQRMGIDLPIDAISSATVVGFTNFKMAHITLEKALQWTLEKNPTLAQSRYRVELADESIIQSRATLSPQLDASVNHTRNGSSGNTVITGNPDQTTLASVNLSQTLYSIVDKTAYDLAKLDKLAQQHQNDANIQSTVINTLNVFLQVLISEANLAAQQENVRLARSNLSMAEKRVKLGSGTAGDIYNSESTIASANSNLLAARIGALEARRSLMDLSNTEFNENAVFDDVDLNHPSVASSHVLVQPLLETLGGIQNLANWTADQAIAVSPRLKALSVSIDSNRKQVKAAAKGRYSPEVKLKGQAIDYLDSSTGTSGTSFEDVDDVSLSVNVTFPIWTSGRLTSLVRQANNLLIDAELEYRASKNTIQVDAKNAVFTLAQAWQDIKLGKIALASAEKSLEINQRAYASGALTIENLQSIQNTYISALSADKSNLYQYIQALGNWQLQVAAVTHLMKSDSYAQWVSDFKAQHLIQ